MFCISGDKINEMKHQQHEMININHIGRIQMKLHATCWRIINIIIISCWHLQVIIPYREYSLLIETWSNNSHETVRLTSTCCHLHLRCWLSPIRAPVQHHNRYDRARGWSWLRLLIERHESPWMDTTASDERQMATKDWSNPIHSVTCVASIIQVLKDSYITLLSNHTSCGWNLWLIYYNSMSCEDQLENFGSNLLSSCHMVTSDGKIVNIYWTKKNPINRYIICIFMNYESVKQQHPWHIYKMKAF